MLAAVVRAQADRVDRGFRSLREVEHLLERQQARRVLAVGEHDDRLAADLVDVLRDDLLQILQRDVDRVVQRRRAAGRRLADRLLELGGVVGEALQHDDAAVEVDDLGEILRPQPLARSRSPLPAPSAASCPCSRWCRAAARARSAGCVRLKKVTSCLTPSSKTLKSSCVRSVTYRGAVGDRDVQRHEVDAGAERRAPAAPAGAASDRPAAVAAAAASAAAGRPARCRTRRPRRTRSAAGGRRVTCSSPACPRTMSSGPLGRDDDLLGRNQRLRPGVGHAVLVGQLVGDLLQAVGQGARGQDVVVASAGRLGAPSRTSSRARGPPASSGRWAAARS